MISNILNEQQLKKKITFYKKEKNKIVLCHGVFDVVHIGHIKHFEKAKKFVHKLNLNSSKEWARYYNSGKLPLNIPKIPREVYKNKGWISMGDWLGTNTVATYLINYRSFFLARTFVRTLELKNVREWSEYCKTGNRPDDIPANPAKVYKNKGWVSYVDWLGIKTVATYNMEFLSYYDAKKIVHKLNIKNATLGLYANNVWLIYSDLPWIDPSEIEKRSGYNWAEAGQLPNTRTIGLNLNLRF